MLNTHPTRCSCAHAIAFAAVPLILATTNPQHAHAQGQYTTIAQSGATAPDGVGRYGDFGPDPRINNAGHIAFSVEQYIATGVTPDNDTSINLFDGTTTHIIAREGASAPGGVGVYGHFASAASNTIQGSGTGGSVLFTNELRDTPAHPTDNDALYLGTPGTVHEVIRERTPAPAGVGNYTNDIEFATDGPTYTALTGELASPPGGVLEDQYLARASAGTVTLLATENQPFPNDPSWEYIAFGEPDINATGQIAVTASLRPVAGSGSDAAILRFNPDASITTLARKDDPAPDGNGVFGHFSTFSSPADINDHGETVFFANLNDTLMGTDDTIGIFYANGSTINQIARENNPAPDGNGVYQTFSTPGGVINDAGHILFAAWLRDTLHGPDDDKALILHKAGTSQVVIHKSDPAPDGNGTFKATGEWTINNNGVIAYLSTLDNTALGTTDDQILVLTDGTDTITVAREDAPIAGGTVDAISIAAGRQNHNALNDRNELVFEVQLTSGNERIFKFTPDLHWRNNASGQWSSSNNWTLGIAPDEQYNVLIDPTGGLTVAGPRLPATVRKLTIGATATGIAKLNLNDDDILATNNITVNPNGHLHFDNNTTVSTGDVINDGLITGTGQIAAELLNQTGTVRTDPGQSLTIAGNSMNDGTIQSNGGSIHFYNQLESNGDIQLVNATFQVDGLASNAFSTATLFAQNSSLHFPAGMDNLGTVAMSFGNNNIFGPINNTPAARIIISGASTATFLNDVTNNGTLQISNGSSAVFFGDVTGSGSYPGGGTAYFEGDLFPGSSPGINHFGGNLTFGPAASLQIETIATTTAPIPGTDNDQLIITDTITLNGRLNITPLPDAGPIETTPYGTEYLAITYNTRTPNSFFHTITGTLINTTFALAPLLNESTNELTLRASIPGDLNLDNKVSIADLSTFALNFNTTPGLHNELENKSSWLYGDFNTDGAITVADLSLLALNFGFELLPDGTTTPTTPLSLLDAATLAGIDPTTITAVPEPTTAASLLTALIAPYLRHRKNR